MSPRAGEPGTRSLHLGRAAPRHRWWFGFFVSFSLKIIQRGSQAPHQALRTHGAPVSGYQVPSAHTSQSLSDFPPAPARSDLSSSRIFVKPTVRTDGSATPTSARSSSPLLRCFRLPILPSPRCCSTCKHFCHGQPDHQQHVSSETCLCDCQKGVKLGKVKKPPLCCILHNEHWQLGGE